MGNFCREPERRSGRSTVQRSDSWIIDQKRITACAFILSTAPESMYMYEGEDYSKPSDADKKTFDQLLTGIVQLYLL